MNFRNTSQKMLIIDTLKILKTHPTIYELYDILKEKDSSIGMATVYRNIKKFVDEGKVFVIKTKLGQTRYDYYGNHLHLECLICGKIIDLFNYDIFDIINKSVSQHNFDMKLCSITVEGYCKNCKK